MQGSRVAAALQDYIFLPAGFHDTRDLTLKRQAAKAQTADPEFAQKRARTPAELAPVVLT